MKNTNNQEENNNVVSYTEDGVVPSAKLETMKTLHSALHQKTIEGYGNMIVKNWLEYEKQ